MHINESSRRRIGGTVDVNLGRYGNFSFGTTWEEAQAAEAEREYQERSAADGTGGYTSPAGTPTAESGPGALDWVSKLLGVAGSVAPGIITAVKGPNVVVGGVPKQGAVYTNPPNNLGIIVPIAIGAVVLVGAAIVMKSSRKPSMAGYRRKGRKARR